MVNTVSIIGGINDRGYMPLVIEPGGCEVAERLGPGGQAFPAHVPLAVSRKTWRILFGRVVPAGSHEPDGIEQPAIGRQIDGQTGTLVNVAIEGIMIFGRVEQ